MAVPARPYDALYDAATYTVSGARDHYRQQTVAGGFMVERAPNYPNMFSELPHMPASGYRFKNSDKVPGFVDRTFQQTQTSAFELQTMSQPAQVNGPNRYKHFRRPLLAAPDPVIIKQAPPQPAPPPVPHVEEPKSKTVGTQSDYRENEAQTTPWDPNFVIAQPSIKQQALSAKHNTDGPELLKLRDLKFGDGLPPGLQEVRRIEKLREKRAFEATLPPLSDVDQLPLRQKMLDEWESKEWAEREGEILSVQDERLALLEQALIAREDEFDDATMRRVEQRKTTMLQERSERFATIQANRIKTMRQLIEARKYVEKPRKLHKLTVVEKYANFGSSTYAPVQRDGRFPDSKPHGQTIETEGFQPATLQGLAELETYLPSKLLHPHVAAPRKPAKLNYQQRQDAAIQRDLKAINELLDTAKASKGRGVGECWPAPLKDTADMRKSARSRTAARSTDRPETPVLPASATAGREAAVVLLQRLLRGRAAQNIMYEGKTRCQALIQELSMEGRGATTRPEETDLSGPIDTIIGLVFSNLCAALADNNPVSRAEKLAELYGPSMAPPPEDDEAEAAAYAASAAPSRAASRPATASRHGPKGVGFDADAMGAPESVGERGPVFERVETKVYTEAGERAVHDAVFARVNTMANTVAGTVASEMAAAVAAAMERVAEEVKRISESGEAAAMAEAAAEAVAAAARASAAGEAEAAEAEAQAAAGIEEAATGEAEAEPEAESTRAAEDTAAAEADSAVDEATPAPAAAVEAEGSSTAVHVPVPPAGRPRSGSSRPTSAAARPASAGTPASAPAAVAEEGSAPEDAGSSVAPAEAGTVEAEREVAAAGDGEDAEQPAAAPADEGDGPAPEAEAQEEEDAPPAPAAQEVAVPSASEEETVPAREAEVSSAPAEEEAAPTPVDADAAPEAAAEPEASEAPEEAAAPAEAGEAEEEGRQEAAEEAAGEPEASAADVAPEAEATAEAQPSAAAEEPPAPVGEEGTEEAPAATTGEEAEEEQQALAAEEAPEEAPAANTGEEAEEEAAEEAAEEAPAASASEAEAGDGAEAQPEATQPAAEDGDGHAPGGEAGPGDEGEAAEAGEQAPEPEVTGEASLAGGEEAGPAPEAEELVGEASLGHALHAAHEDSGAAGAPDAGVSVEGSGALEGEVSLGEGDAA